MCGTNIMKRARRFGVSFDGKLLGLFDSFIKAKGYKNRSEALRDLARERLHSEAGIRASGIIRLLFDRREERGKLGVTSVENCHNCLISLVARKYLDRHLCSDVIYFSGDLHRTERFYSALKACPSVKKAEIDFFESSGSFRPRQGKEESKRG